MTHFLARLVERTRGTAPRVEPLLAPRFASDPVREITTEVESPAAHGAIRSPASMEANPPAAPPMIAKQNEFTPAITQPAEKLSSIEIVQETLLVSPDRYQSASPQFSRPALTEKPSLGAPKNSGTRPSIRSTSRTSSDVVRPAANTQNKPPPFLPDQPAGEAPIVRVTIGRIEVRAGPVPAAPAKPSARPEPKLSLDAYLKSRKEGAR